MSFNLRSINRGDRVVAHMGKGRNKYPARGRLVHPIFLNVFVDLDHPEI
jgi:hypothetical protein